MINQTYGGNFNFTGDPDEGISIFLDVLDACYFLLFVVFSGLLFLRRENPFLRIRFVPTLFLFFLFQLYSLLVSSASIIGGKQNTCHPLEVLYCSASFFTFHFLLSPVFLVLAAIKNEEKRNYSLEGGQKGIWRLVPYMNSVLWRLVFALLLAGIHMAVYVPIRVRIPLPGDCNRTAILILGCFNLAVGLICSPINYRLWFVTDPFFWKFESVITSIISLPTSILLLMYPINPDIFPSWFDFRWLNIYNSLVTLIGVVIFPVLLTFPKFESLTRRTFRVKAVVDEDDLGAKTNSFLFSLKSKEIDELHAVLDHPILKDAFINFCTDLWCVENVLFILEVREFKSRFAESDSSSRLKAGKIMAQFIAWNSPLEINILDQTRRAVQATFAKPPIDQNLFQPAEKEISELIKNDSLKKWYLTPEFKSLLQRVLSGNGSGSHRESSHVSALEMDR